MATKRRRGWVWLLAALALLGLGGWLMLGAEPPPKPAPQVSLPRKLEGAGLQRMLQRQTWVPLVVVDAGTVAAVEAQSRRDPLLALVPPTLERGVVVAEVNAILNSELGSLAFDCVAGDLQGPISTLADAGFDVKVNLDRVAMVDETLVFTGDFSRLPLAEGWVAKDVGPNAKVYELTPGSGRGARAMGVWRNQLLVMARDEQEVRSALERLEHPKPGASGFPEANAYGEVYGFVNGATLADLVGDGEPQVREVVKAAAAGVTLHLDVQRDVGMVADFDAKDTGRTDELRRTLGGLLSLARLDAQREGRTEAAEVLDLARVRPASGGSFRMEAGVPHELAKGLLERCITRRRARQAVDGGR